MGEVNAAKTLVAEIERQFGDCEIVISTTTDTGYAQADKLFGRKWPVFYFPFDVSWIVRRAFDRLQPSICLLMELEVWPNFIFTAHERHVPVVVLNGRISDRSFSRYRRIKRVTRTFFGKIDRVLAQTQEYAERFRELGCPAERVLVTSSLKYDTAQVADRVEGAEALAEQLNLGGARLWVAGGTGNDEEKIILDVYKSLTQDAGADGLRLAVVPRKPERFDEVAQLIEQMGLPMVRYSRLKGTTTRASRRSQRRDPRRHHGRPAEILLAGRDHLRGPHARADGRLGHDGSGGARQVHALRPARVQLPPDGRGPVAGPRRHRSEGRRRPAGDHAKVPVRSGLCRELSPDPGQEIIRQNQGATARTMEVLRTLLQGSARIMTQNARQVEASPESDAPL